MGVMNSTFSELDIQAAHDRIAGSIYRTPCRCSEALSDLCGATVFVKFENLQATGSFKERGAANKLACLSEEDRERGVITASAGNHGLGIAHQARALGIRATVVMPKRAPLIKQVLVKRLGGAVLLHGATYEDAVARAQDMANAERLTYVHGFDDLEVIAGQGTLGIEIAEDVAALDAVLVPVGGGGLVAGLGTAIKSRCPGARIIGVEPERCPSMIRAFAGGAPETIDALPTIADGLAVKCVGKLTFPIARAVVDEMVAVTEDEIAHAILALLEIEKTVVEGAGAAGLAALLSGKVDLRGKTVVIPLTGGNIDMTMVSHILERGLAKDGRLVWLRTYVNDQPGMLSRVSQLLSESGASVKDVYHNRAFGRVEPGNVEIDWILETRGHDHIEELLETLREHGIRVTTYEEGPPVSQT